MSQAPTLGTRILNGATIEVAVAGPVTGNSAALGAEMKQAVELAVLETNKAGGLLGARLTACVVDDASRVDVGDAAARRLASRPTILGVVGHYNSDVGLRASEIYNDHDLAMINPITSNPSLTERGLKTVFRFTNRDDRTGMAIAQYLRSELKKRAAVVVASDSTYGRSMADCFDHAFARCGGETIGKYVIREGERDFGAFVRDLPREFDVLFYGGTFEGAALLCALRAKGLDQRFATGDGCWDRQNFLLPAGEAAEQGEGVLVLSATPEVGSVHGSREFEQAYVQEYGPILNYAANSYDSTRMLVLAIEHAAAAKGALPDRLEVVASLRQVEFQGIAYRVPVKWNAKGDNRNAVTALHEVRSARYQQIAEIETTEAEADPHANVEPS